MPQDDFTMKPKTSETKEKAVSEATNPDAQNSQTAENNPPTEQRDIEVITVEIQFYKRQTAEGIYEIGKRLIEVKAQLEHGDWLKWLRDERIKFSDRTANRFMKVVKGYPNSTTLSDLGLAKTLALLGLPDDERDEFMTKAHDINGVEKSVGAMSCRELEKVVREHKNPVSSDKSDKKSDSADEQEDDDTKNIEGVDWATQDPVTFLIGKVLEFENVVDDVLGMLATQMDSAEEQEELVSKLRSICDKALRELPPIKSDAEKLLA